MNYKTKDRRHSSQRMEGKWTSKQCHGIMLPELYKLCCLQGQTTHKRETALVYFPLLVLKAPNSDSWSTEPWVRDRKETQSKNMNNAELVHQTSVHFPRLSSQAVVGRLFDL